MNALNQSFEVPKQQTAGTILKAARLEQNLNAEQVSNHLHLALWQIEALENDQYDRLAGSTFVRGIIRSYSKALRIDPQPALEAYSRVVPIVTPVEINVPSQNIRFRPGKFGGWNIAGNKGAQLVLALVFVFLGISFFYTPSQRKEKQVTPTQAQIPKNVMLNSSVAMVPATNAAVSPNIAETPPSADAKLIAEKPVAITNNVVSVEKTGDAGLSHVTRNLSAVINNDNGAMSAAASYAKSAVRMMFTDKSWVEVKDGNGKIIFRELNPRGSERTLNGEPPFAMVIGNAAGVRLFYKEKPVDLAPHTQVRVARLTLE